MHIEDGKDVVRSARYGLGLASALLTGCLAGTRPPSVAAAPPAPETGGLQVPGSYMISRSCGSEWGDLMVLTLLPGGVFSLRQTYRDVNCAQPVTLVYLGEWRIEDDDGELRLDNGPVWLRRLAILNHRALRIPDRPPPEPPPHTVVQTAFRTPLLPFRDPFHLRGVGAFPAWSE
ncbi:MAG TPA: hypothetical protein VFT28_06285 [Gemmatimonadales bacterium]|nr:hypothetical protein [Gemmatimonadales bacterium]